MKHLLLIALVLRPLQILVTTIMKMMMATTPAVAEVKAPTTAKGLLEFLDIELTERCNLACHHCYIRRGLHDQQALTKEMSLEFIKCLLKQAVSFGCGGVRFTGGEPMVRSDFKEIYLYAYSLDLRVSLATNATCITEEFAELLAQKPPELISISLYGWDETSYAQVTGRSGLFNQFLTGIGRLREYGISFKLKYPPTRFLVENSDKLQALAKQLGFEEELPFAWELTMHSRHDASASKRIQACRMNPEQAARQRLRDPEIGERDCKAIRAGKMKFTKRIFACRGAKKRLAIDAYGQLQACLEVRHPDTTYELSTGSLEDALLNHLPQCRKLHFTNPDYLNHCGQCLLRPACPLCPACSWMENGNLEIPSEHHCEVMHAEARILGLLQEGEKGWETKALYTPIA